MLRLPIQLLTALVLALLCLASAPQRAHALVAILPEPGTAVLAQILGNQWIAFRPTSGAACQFWFLGGQEAQEDFRIVGSSGKDTIYTIKASGSTFCNFPIEPFVAGSRQWVVFAQEGADTVVGGVGPSQLSGGSGNDFMMTGTNGTAAWARAVGDSGDDWMFGIQRQSRIGGGGDNDRLCVALSPALIYDIDGGSGNDCTNGTSSPLTPIGIERPCTVAECDLF